MDIVTNDFLFIFEELQGKAGRRLTEMIGKRYTRTQLVCDSRQNRTLYVPLPWWYCQHSGNALSLASLQFHGVALHCEFSRLEHCIVTSGPNVAVKHARNACNLQHTDLKAQIITSFVYLGHAERERFAVNHYEVLVTQHQTFYTQVTSSQPRIQLNFNHPVLELYVAIRRQCHERVNNHFCFSGIDNRDPLITADLLVNNQSRFGKKSGLFYRTVVPYETHTNIPDTFIYVMSFSLHPEDHTAPSGSINMSRIDHCDLVLELQEDFSLILHHHGARHQLQHPSIQGGARRSRVRFVDAPRVRHVHFLCPLSPAFVVLFLYPCVPYLSVTLCVIRLHLHAAICTMSFYICRVCHRALFLLPCSHGISFFLTRRTTCTAPTPCPQSHRARAQVVLSRLESERHAYM